MEKVYIHGEIIYKDGWFVYIRSNGEVCALTRADAHMVENSGRAYDLYDRGMTDMARSVEGVRTFEEFGISNSHPTIPEYKVDALAPASSDVIIGDVLTIPEKVGEYTINAILENSFQKLQISKIILPATIEKVSRGAFDRCESLKQVIFDGCTPDVSNAFTGCNNLQYDNGFLRFGNTIVKTSEQLGPRA